MQTVRNSKKKPESQQPKNYKRLIVTVLSLLILTVLVMGLYLGLARMKRANELASTCKGDPRLISDYNQAVRAKGAAKLGDIAKKVEAKKHYTQDATCIYILMVSEYGHQDRTKQAERYHQLQSLESQGVKLDGSINDGVNRQQLENLIIMQEQEKGTARAPGQG